MGTDGYPSVTLCKKTEKKRFWDVIAPTLREPQEGKLKKLRPHEQWGREDDVYISLPGYLICPFESQNKIA